MDLGPHANFIIASYAAAAAIICALIIWLAADGHRQRTALAELEHQGVRRRSSAG